jgi:hypothetical protein
MGVVMEISIGDKLDAMTVKLNPVVFKKPKPVYAKQADDRA